VDFYLEPRLLKLASHELGIEFISPVAVFRRNLNQGTLSYPINGHMTPIAHGLLARHLCEKSTYLKATIKNNGCMSGIDNTLTGDLTE
jgi:hypothetical protein